MGCSHGKTTSPASAPPALNSVKTTLLDATAPPQESKTVTIAEGGELRQDEVLAIARDGQAPPEANSQAAPAESVTVPAEPEVGEPAELERVLEEQKQRLQQDSDGQAPEVREPTQPERLLEERRGSLKTNADSNEAGHATNENTQTTLPASKHSPIQASPAETPLGQQSPPKAPTCQHTVAGEAAPKAATPAGDDLSKKHTIARNARKDCPSCCC